MSDQILNNEEEMEQPARAPDSSEQRTIGGAGVTLAVMGLIDVIGHMGPTGLVVSGLASYVVWRHGPEVYGLVQHELGLPDVAARFGLKKERVPNKRTFWQKAWNIHPQGREETEADEEETIDEEHAREDLHEGDSVFTVPQISTEVPGVSRITIEQAVEHTTRNSYEVWIGRSLSRPINPAVKINFYKRHLKLIGASQHGKSSMAAALLDAITRTHDPRVVQVALLDLEDKTGRLFADLPHIARVRKHGEAVRLHARSYEQVLEHLGYISAVIDLRYGMSDEEIERQTLLIVYLEEFVDLKDYFKQRINAVESDEKEQAKRDYAQLVYYIKKIAARGLKVYVQLLMCAQVDYRDDDLQAALVNVTSGMSFCVRPSAAQAAGFYQTELLSRNAKEDKIGQAVVEMPDCKDLILAPDYDLKARLKALTEREKRKIVPMVRDSGLLQREGDVRSYQDSGLASPGVRTYGINEPVEQEDSRPGRDFEPGLGEGHVPDDKQEDLAYFYKKHGRCEKGPLREIGVGNHSYRHAAWLLEQRGLKTIRRA